MSRWPKGDRRGGSFAPSGIGGFTRAIQGGVPPNAIAIRTATGLDVGHLRRTASASSLNHASRFSKSGRVPPSRAVLRRYALHATSAHGYRLQGQRGHGAGLRLRSEIDIAGRSYTLVERIGERSARLWFVTMWENG